MLLFETSSLSNLLLEVNAVNVIKQTVIISLGSCVSISTMTAEHSFSLKSVCLLDQVCDVPFEYSADYHAFKILPSKFCVSCIFGAKMCKHFSQGFMSEVQAQKNLG